MLFLLCGVIGAVLLAATAHSPLSAILRAISGFLILGTIGYFATPTLGFNFLFLPFWVLVFGVAGVILSGMQEKASLGGFALAAIGAIWLIVIPLFTTWGGWFGHAAEYRDMIGEVQESRFADDVSPVDINQVRTVNEDLARRVADKRLGALGSRVDLGQMNIQVVTGCFSSVEEGRRQRECFDSELVWVAPLVHSGFWKQNAHHTTPGYVIVSATDVSRVLMVTELTSVSTDAVPANPRMGATADGTASAAPIGMRYFQQGGYFGYNVERHLRNNGYLTQGITDFSFEIRDGDGRPFWVVTTYEKKVGFAGADATGVVTVDTQTGDIKAYGIDDAPAWIDRIQPESFVQTQLDDWGKLARGYWNWGGTDKKQTTPGMSLVFGADGQSYWYSGIQSVGSDEGTIGFVLVNTRTKDARLYKVKGATETAAESAAQDNEAAKRASLTSGSAILYNVGGVPTYFVTLHATNGLPQMYAFIKVEDYNVVGIGRTPQEALRSYQIKLSQNRTVDVDDLVERETFEAVIKAVATERVGDTQFYYFLLEGKDGKEYYAGQSLSAELKWTKAGDTVEVAIDDGESRSVNIVSFDNKGVSLAN